MAHLSSISKLKRAKDHRVALVKNLTKELLKHGKIETTSTKSRATSKYLDRLFVKAMGSDKEKAKRDVFQMINDQSLTDKVMNVYLPNVNGRKSGFSGRYILRNRPGDNAEIVLMTLLTVKEEKKESKKEVKSEIKSKEEKK